MRANRNSVLRIAFLIGWISLAGICSAQDVLLTEPPKQLRAFGTVCDENGKGIPHADVMLIVAGHYSWEDFADLAGNQTRSTKTNEVGEFELIIQTDDPLVALSLGIRQLLVVQASGFCTQVVDLKLASGLQLGSSRLMIDLPFKIKTHRCSDLRLQVFSAEGTPIAGAQVKPAAMANQKFPNTIPWLTEAKTDEQGRVTLAGLDLSSLESVYVETPTQGNQQVPITIENQQAIARLAKTGRMTGRLILSDDSNPQTLLGTKLLLMTFVSDSQNSTRQSWRHVEVDGNGTFSADQMGLGQTLIQLITNPGPAEAGFLLPYQQFAPLEVNESGKASVELEVKISPVQTEKIQLIDEAGKPLPGIYVAQAQGIFSAKPQVTSQDGVYLHRWPKGESLSGQLFPQDTLGCYQVTDPFGVRLDRLEAKEGQVRTVQLTRSQSLHGIVVDKQGNRLAGATISYSYASERFRNEADTLSDSSGKFEIRGLPPSISVEIQASLDNLATDSGQVLSVAAGIPQETRLVLTPQVTASPIGRVVDESGNPVADVKVTLQKGVVRQEEGYGGEDLNAEEIAAGFATVLSDQDGRFQFPAIRNFGARLKLKIERAGFLTRETPFMNGSSREIENQQIDLGTVKIFREPTIIQAKVEVVDQMTGQPLPKTEVVFVGFLSGRLVGLTDAAGELELDLKTGPQLVAARSPDHQIRFEFFDQIDGKITLRLNSKPAEAVHKPHPWFQRDPQSYLAASRRLMDQLDLPSATESTFFRQYLYFKALAGLDLEQLETTLGGEQSEYEHRDDFLMLNTESILKQSPQKAVELCRASKASAGQKITIYSMAARSEPDGDVKDELYGEAALLLSELTGADRLITAGRLAKFLLLDDRVEAAETVIEEAWATADELKKILSSGEEKTMIAESRIYLPLYSILNLDDAIKLIRLTALQPEKEGLLTEALLIHSLARDLPLAQLARERKIEISSQDMLVLMGELGDVPSLGKYFAANLDAIPASAMKIQAALLAARHLPPGGQRNQLLQLAAELRSRCVMTYFFDDPAYVALREVAQFKSLQAGELDAFTFACLKHAPDRFLDRSMMEAFGSLAKLLAFHDPALARKFLQSAIDVDGWHGGVEYPSRFSNNELLKSAAWIDPEFACEVAETLAKSWDREGPTNKLQLYSDMIQALNNVRFAFD